MAFHFCQKVRKFLTRKIRPIIQKFAFPLTSLFSLFKLLEQVRGIGKRFTTVNTGKGRESRKFAAKIIKIRNEIGASVSDVKWPVWPFLASHVTRTED